MADLFDQHDLAWDSKCNQDLFELMGDDFGDQAGCSGELNVSIEQHCDNEKVVKSENPDEDEEYQDVFGLGDAKCSKQSVKSRAKACREKARREKLNESFIELAKQVESNKSPKTDKMSILNDAIRMVKALKVENNQLKQLNKFLEEKVQQQERGKGQDLYQSYMSMMQQAASSMQIKSQQVQQGSMDLGQSSTSVNVDNMQSNATNIQAQLHQQQLLQIQQMLQMQQLGGGGILPGLQQNTNQLLQLQQQLMQQQQQQMLTTNQQQASTSPFIIDPQIDMQLRPPAA